MSLNQICQNCRLCNCVSKSDLASAGYVPSVDFGTVSSQPDLASVGYVPSVDFGNVSSLPDLTSAGYALSAEFELLLCLPLPFSPVFFLWSSEV